MYNNKYRQQKARFASVNDVLDKNSNFIGMFINIRDITDQITIETVALNKKILPVAQLAPDCPRDQHTRSIYWRQ
jgi:hypothetical protein